MEYLKEKPLQLAYEFDFVHDGQRVFRQMLKAESKPGTVVSIAGQAEKFSERFAPLSAIGCTLLDNEQTMYVEKNQNLQNLLHDLTLCAPAALEEADYLFLSSEMNYGSIKEIFRNVKRGTYADPQESATLLILCDQITGEQRIELTGPGIKDTLEVPVTLYIKNLIRIRQEIRMEYPLGIELFLVTPQGDLMCVPRLCKMAE